MLPADIDDITGGVVSASGEVVNVLSVEVAVIIPPEVFDSIMKW